jgi:hypothetical protein
MKRYIFFNLIVLFNLLVLTGQNPQPSWILSGEETGNKTYIAQEHVTLKPGFHYKAVNESFTAKVDPCLLFPPTENTYAKPDGTITTNPAEGAVVGSIPGQFNVGPSGAATYSIPIEVPDGINGMKPKVSLDYNSMAGNGIAGWGWNIGGSMISRVRKNLYYDGESGGFDWTKDSPLVLDGQRLIRISESEYRTESESFTKITATSIKPWGPEEFIVQTKDGMTMTYGRKNDNSSYLPLKGIRTYVPGTQTIMSETILANLGWVLTNIKDNFGNFIEYNYKVDYQFLSYCNHRLETIRYGNNQAIVGEINFSYKEREDILEGYLEGERSFNSKILDKIIVSSFNTTIKEYILKYANSDFYSQLVEVGLKSNGSDAINPISMEWGSSEIAHGSFNGNQFAETPLYAEYISNGYAFNHLGIHSYGDIDNDGYLDILVKMQFKKGDTYKHTYVLYRNTGSYFYFVFEGKWSDYTNSIFFLDANHNGKDELYVFGKEEGMGQEISRYLEGFDYYNGSMVSINEADINESLRPYRRYDTRAKYVIPGDFFGDGLMRLALFGDDNEFLLFTGTAPDGSYLGLLDEDIFKGDYSKVYMTNINGNGKPEFLFINNDIASFYEYSIGEKIVDRTGRETSRLKRNTISSNNSGCFHNKDLVYTGDFDGMAILIC